MKFIVLLAFISCSFFVGQDFLYALPDWYQPQIHSMINHSFNGDPIPPAFKIPDYQGVRTQIAVSSVGMTTRSIQQYLSYNDNRGIIFRYSPSYPTRDLMIRVFGGFDFHNNETDNYFFVYKGLKLRSQLARDVSLDGYWWAGQLRGDEKYYMQSPLLDGYYQPGEDKIFIDNLQGALKYNTDNLQLSVGRGKFQVGDNISGSIILNNAANDYGYVASKLKFGTLSLSYMHGALTPDTTEVVFYHPLDSLSAKSARVDKYIVMHKLDWNPVPSFTGFLGEEIVYGNRSLDLNYLMPHVFWRIIEHNLEDRDNVMIFGGLNWKMTHHATFYQNLLLDEFSSSKIFTNWWGSKYALQAGLSYQFLEDKGQAYLPRITVEMTAVRPWTYTHFIKWNKFSNDSLALGYPVGSNCLNYSTELDLPISQRIFIGVNASYSRQGSTGNKFDLNTTDPLLIPNDENTKTYWLEGNITNTKRVKLMAEWKLLAHHFLRLGTTLTQENKADWSNDMVLSYRTEF